jgi:subtilisin family serine protease
MSPDDVTQIDMCKEAGLDKIVDENRYSHGTAVASKSVGKIFGVAKNADLVSIKCMLSATDLQEGIELATTHIEGTVEEICRGDNRKDQSVVSISETCLILRFDSREDALSDDLGQGFQAAIQGLFDIGVPVVVSSGNNAPARPRMDRLPSILEADDFPIITVGAVDLDGSREPVS